MKQIDEKYITLLETLFPDQKEYIDIYKKAPLSVLAIKNKKPEVRLTSLIPIVAAMIVLYATILVNRIEWDLLISAILTIIGIGILFFLLIWSLDSNLTARDERYEIIEYLKIFQEGKEKAEELRVFLEFRKSFPSDRDIGSKKKKIKEMKQ
jgi:hypothetical protein